MKICAGMRTSPIHTRTCPKSTWACALGAVSNRTVARLSVAATRRGWSARRTITEDPTNPSSRSSRHTTAALKPTSGARWVIHARYGSSCDTVGRRARSRSPPYRPQVRTVVRSSAVGAGDHGHRGHRFTPRARARGHNLLHHRLCYHYHRSRPRLPGRCGRSRRSCVVLRPQRSRPCAQLPVRRVGNFRRSRTGEFHASSDSGNSMCSSSESLLTDIRQVAPHP